jgi:hypothetical protein
MSHSGSVNRRWCAVQLKIANDKAERGMKSLTDLAA